MKKYFNLYKPFLLFLAKFLISYLVLTVIYQSYLNRFDKQTFETDSFTIIVAHQTADLLQLFNANTHTEPSKTEPCMNFYYNNKFSSRIIEGCNAISVMILFTAFVIAFSGRIKHTILYILAGVFLIHFMNIVRITLLNVASFHYPQYDVLLHDIIFPLFIYGVVFILWIIWINKFSKYAKKNV